MDAVIFFWARLSEMETGLDERLLAALRAWFNEEWKIKRAVYVTNEQFTRQVDLIERTDMNLKFELREPDKLGIPVATPHESDQFRRRAIRAFDR